MADRRPELWGRLCKLAARPEGYSTAEAVTATGYPRKAVCRASQNLIKYKLVVALRVTHKYSRYFVDEAQRVAFAAKLAANMQRSPRVAPVVTRHRRGGVHACWGPEVVAVVPKHVKVQHCTCPEPRFTVVEFEFIHKGK